MDEVCWLLNLEGHFTDTILTFDWLEKNVYWIFCINKYRRSLERFNGQKNWYVTLLLILLKKKTYLGIFMYT